MLDVNNLNILISRGDTGSITITLQGDDVPDDTTEALFVLQRTNDSETPIWEKRLAVHDGQVVVPFETADTIGLIRGEYRWILRLLYEDGSVYTPMEQFAKFTVLAANGSIVSESESGGDGGE